MSKTNEHAAHFSKGMQKIPAKIQVLDSYAELSGFQSLSVPETKIHFTQDKGSMSRIKILIIVLQH